MKFIKNPLGFMKNVIYKIFVIPFKYSKNKHFNASAYWQDRLSKYGFSLKGAGDEGLSEKDNKKMYEEASRTFMNFCRKEGIDFKNSNVLEIGVGSGFYTQLLSDSEVKSYVGIDITDVLFPNLKKRFPKFKFVKKDVTADKIDNKFDFIIMIDVIEHIVEEAKLSFAMENVKDSIEEKGIFIVSPIRKTRKKILFHDKSWDITKFKELFSGYIFSELIPFRNDSIVVIKKS